MVDRKETQMYRTVFWTLWDKVRMGWFERIALKHVYYHMWNRSAVQVQCMSSGLVHWDDPEGWYGEGRGRGIQDGLSHWTTREVPKFTSSTCKKSTSSLSKKYVFITTHLETGTCCELNICVPPATHTNSCWNSKPWCDGIRTWGFQ